MSTYFRPTTPVKLDDIRKVLDVDVTEKDKVILFQSNGSHLVVDMNSKGYVIDVYRYGGNHEEDIFPKIKEHFGVSFTSEYDDDYEDYCDEETKVFMIHYPDGQCCYSNKVESDDGVKTVRMNF